MNEIHRDEVLGAALRELPVPEHGPEFWRRLEGALEAAGAERPRAEAAPPRPRAAERPAAGAARRRGPATRGGRLARLPRASRRLRLGIAAGLGAAVGIAALVVGLPRTGTPEPALAEVVQKRVAAAIDELEDVRLSGTWWDRGHGRVPFRLALTADGDLFFHQRGSKGVQGADAARTITVAYDARRGIERELTPGSPGGEVDGFPVEATPPVFAERRGVAPGPPDRGVPDPFPLQRRLGAAVRALLEADDPSVSEATWRGRDAWRATIELETGRPPAPREVDRLVVVVDKGTGLPVRIQGSLRGRLVQRTAVDRLAVNEGIEPGAFRLQPPPEAEIHRRSEGFRRVPVEEVQEIVGYEPLVPDHLPEGYEPAEVAAAAQGETDALAGRWSRGVVSLSYRRGFDQLTITTRRAAGGPSDWADPFDLGLDEPTEPLQLSAGALAGARGELVASSQQLPHLWAVGDGLLLTVAGNLRSEELVGVAESLAPLPPP